MAVKGNLRDFNVTQLLNLINLARKTGTLTIEGPSEAAWVSFREGKLIYAQLGSEDGSLRGILARAGELSPRQRPAGAPRGAVPRAGGRRSPRTWIWL